MDINTCISHPAEGVHPRNTLHSHVATVASRMSKFLSGEVEEIGEIAGYVHDITKSTEEFQRYLRDEISDAHNHAPSSAVFALGCAIFHPKEFNSKDLMLLYSAVYYHHRTRLDTKPPHIELHKSYNEKPASFSGEFKNPIEVAEKRLKDIKEFPVGLRTARNIINQATNGEFDSSNDVEDIIKVAEDWIDNNYSDEFNLEANANLTDNQTYEKYIDIWGSLALADISHSSRVSVPIPFERPTSKVMDEHISGLSVTDKIDEYRSEARSEVLSNVTNIDWSQNSIGQLSLPTGLGKTYTGISAAIKIIDNLDNKDNISVKENNYVTSSPRNIIYALPYTSIIDQTKEDLESVFDIKCKHSSRLTTHHHLSDTVSSAENEKIGGFLGESWFSGLTLTTFVQLFESVLVPTRSSSTKLPQLRDSVIILDEPQTLPRDWWSIIQRIAKTLIDHYNVTIISMTATQPRIFEESSELDPCSLLSSSEYYYEQECVKRINYYVTDSVLSEDKKYGYENLSEDLIESARDGKTLAVLNTIDSANKIAKQITESKSVKSVNKELKDSATDPQGFADNIASQVSEDEIMHIHLTSRHRPVDRVRLIRTIRELSYKTSLVVTSTQILEAGVDVSFSQVYRDIAPIQNIAQTAGRCNRDGKNELGEVRIIQLKHPNDAERKPPSEAVYNTGTNVIKVTKDILEKAQDNGLIKQKALDFDSVQMYYDELWKRTQGKSTYVDMYNNCDLSMLSELSLIDSKKSVDVVITDDRVITEIRDAYSSHQFDRVESLMDDVTMYELSVPVWDDTEEEKVASLELLHEFDRRNRRVITDIKNSSFYSYTLGFTIPESTVSNRIL